MTEHQHQKALIEWANLHVWGPLLVKITNEQKNGENFGVVKTLLSEGLRPGFPDLFLFLPKHHYHGLALELKAPKKKPSENQLYYLKILGGHGYKTCVSDDLDYSMSKIKEYIGCSRVK